MAKDFVAVCKGKLNSMMVGSHYAAAKVLKTCESIKRRRDNMDADIHAAAVAAIYLSMHKSEYDGGSSNGEPARQLMNALPRSARAKTLADWFEANSNIVLTFDKRAGEYKVKMTPRNSPDYKVPTPEKAFDKPFWSVKEKTNGPRAFVLVDSMAKIANAIKGHDEGKVLMTPEDYEAAKMLIKFANENGVATSKEKAA